MAKIAVVGGGIFGCTAAIYAARSGHMVVLYEENPELLSAASGINQYRLHRGYHYPRSSDTARSALDAETSFYEEYGDAVIRGGRHLYAIAKEGSAVNAAQFRAFCDAHGLAHREVYEPSLVNHDKIETLLEADESWYDPHALRRIVREKLGGTNVEIRLNTRAEEKHLDGYDRVIFAAYARHNPSAHFLPKRREHQYEVCEKPVVALPDSFGVTGIVVMDGPFMCVDPYGRTGYYVLGNVVHAIHRSTVGLAPDIPEEIKPLLNAGLINDPSVTKISDFLSHGSEYLPVLRHAKHIGSMYTIRTVLPRLEATDARPTEVRKLDDRHIKIFSGKVGNCVEAARKAVLLI